MPAALYGVLGYPVKHSLSPAMHSRAFASLGIDAEYRLFEKSPQELPKFLASLASENIRGLNITVPYKERILEFVTLDEKSHYLRRIKAVNTIVRKGDAWLGFNTDIAGFSRHLKEQFEPRGARVALLGAGGASRAVAFSLASSMAKEISIFDVERAKAQDVAGMIRGIFPDYPITPVASVAELRLSEKELLVNATPVGLKESDPLLVDAGALRKDLFVYDLIYNPAETKLLAAARSAGARVSNGLGMLLYQGALSFKIWTGKEPPEEAMRQALLEALKC